VSLKDAGLKGIGREPEGMANPLRGAQGSWRGSQRRGAFRSGFQVPHSRFEGSMRKRGRCPDEAAKPLRISKRNLKVFVTRDLPGSELELCGPTIRQLPGGGRCDKRNC
jgi:hypothetical protein